MERLNMIIGLLLAIMLFSCKIQNKKIKNLSIKNLQVKCYSETEDLNSNIKIYLQLENQKLSDNSLGIKVFQNDLVNRTYYDSIRSDYDFIIINNDTCKLIFRKDKSFNLFLEPKFRFDITGTTIKSVLKNYDYFINQSKFAVYNFRDKLITDVSKSKDFAIKIFINDTLLLKEDSTILNKNFIQLPSLKK